MLEVQWFACYWKSIPYCSVWSLPSMVPLSWNSKENSQANLCFTRFLCGSQLHLSLSDTFQEQNFDLNLEANELWVTTHCSLFICWYTFIEGFILRNSHNCGKLISSVSVGLTAGCSSRRDLQFRFRGDINFNKHRIHYPFITWMIDRVSERCTWRHSFFMTSFLVENWWYQFK